MFDGINFIKAIEAKSKVLGLPNLHILIGKEENIYIGFCLDTGINIVYDKEDNIDNASEYIFEKVCNGSLSQFLYSYLKGEEYLLSSRVEDRKYWDIYDELFSKVRKGRLKEILDKYALDDPGSRIILSSLYEQYDKISENELSDEDTFNYNILMRTMISFFYLKKPAPISLIKKIYFLKG